MAKHLKPGENRLLGESRFTIRVSGHPRHLRFGLGALPVEGHDSPCLPLQNDIPRWTPEGHDPRQFVVDLDLVDPQTDHILLFAQAAPGDTTLSDLEALTCTANDFEFILHRNDLDVACAIFAEIYRHKGQWKIRGKAEGVFEGVGELGRRLGLSIQDRTRQQSIRHAPPPTSSSSEHRPFPGSSHTGEWGGSGFLVAPGYLITNAHVVDRAHQITIQGYNGRHVAEPVIIDQSADLALIRARGIDAAKPFALRAAPGPALGELVTSIGFPLADVLGSGAKLGQGIVSGLLGPRDDARQFQTTAPVQPGSSGGPLVDATGAVIGIVTSTLTNTQNVNLGIRASLAASLLEAVGVSPLYAEKDRSATSLTADCIPLVWRLHCH